MIEIIIIAAAIGFFAGCALGTFTERWRCYDILVEHQRNMDVIEAHRAKAQGKR